MLCSFFNPLTAIEHLSVSNKTHVLTSSVISNDWSLHLSDISILNLQQQIINKKIYIESQPIGMSGKVPISQAKIDLQWKNKLKISCRLMHNWLAIYRQIRKKLFFTIIYELTCWIWNQYNIKSIWTWKLECIDFGHFSPFQQFKIIRIWWRVKHSELLSCNWKRKCIELLNRLTRC